MEQAASSIFKMKKGNEKNIVKMGNSVSNF